MKDLVQDVEINAHLEKFLVFTFIAAFGCLAIGLTTSMSVLAGFHIFLIPSVLYFIPKANYKNYPKSAWFLLLFSLAIIASIVVNQDIIANGYRNLGKVKYFLFGFFGIAPVAWFSKRHLTKKHVSIFLYLLFVATTIGTISGLIGKFYGINPITMKVPNLIERNSGLMGMVMNYAHNLSFFLIINVGLILYREKTKEYINWKFLIFCLIVNLIGFYFSYTRGAWIGFLGAVPFFFLKTNKKIFVSLVVLGLLGGGVVYTIAGSKVRRSYSDDQRIDLWKAAIYAFKDRPFLGYGYLNFEPHSVDVKHKLNLPTAADIRSHAHNNFLEVLATTGFIGFILFMLWNFLWFIEQFKIQQRIDLIVLPLIFTILFGGLTQATLSLGVNLFFIMFIYMTGYFSFDFKVDNRVA